MAVTTTYANAVISGAQILNNSVTAGTQSKVALTKAGSGFAATWNDGQANGDVAMRFFDGTPAPLSGEFVANSTTTNLQSNASLTTLTDGRVIAVYVDASASVTSPSFRGRVFSSTGAPAGADFAITPSAFGPKGLSQPDVTALGNGNFAVAYSTEYSSPVGDFDAGFVIYSPAGARIASYALNASTSVASTQPSIAALTGGGFVVVWTEKPVAGGAETLYYQRFTDAGAKIDLNPVLDDNTGNLNNDAQVIGLNDGGFAFVFTDSGWSSGNADTDITLKIYNANGTVRYGGARINATTAGDQNLPSISQLGNGILQISWSSGTTATFASFLPDGTPLTSISGASFGETETVALSGGLYALGYSAPGTFSPDTNGGFVGWQTLDLQRTSVGDAAADIITGDELTDRITGGGGADQLTGGGGADTFIYTALSDSTAAAQDVITDFATGVDKIDLGSAIGSGGSVAVNRSGFNTTIFFQNSTGSAGGTGKIGVNGIVQGYDFVVSSTTSLFITGDGGPDVIYGSDYKDNINGGGGNDAIQGGLGADTLTGGAGADTFYYANVNQSTAANTDVITDFATGVDKIDLSGAIGATGAVAINRSGSASTIYFTGSTGSGGQIAVNGPVQGYDFNVGSGVTFYITGDGGPDVIYGSNNVDYINGGGGNDAILGGLGADVLTGGAGVDVFYYSAIAQSTTAAADQITDFSTGEDKIDLSGATGSGGAVAVNRSGGLSTIYFQAAGGAGGTGQISVTGLVQGYDFAFGANTALYITGDAGVDVIYGSDLADNINGAGGDDAISGGVGADTITGGAGADIFYYQYVAYSTTSAPDYITDFQTGLDKFNLNGAIGSGGSVAINRSGSSSTIYFQAAGAAGGTGQIGVNGVVQGYDFVGGTNTTFYITGDGGPDVIYGSAGVDIINGGGGDDNILGGVGADQITGGAGADTFYYSSVNDSNLSARDTLQDFTTGTDRINLAALGPGQVNIANTSANCVITFDAAGGGTSLSIFVVGQVRVADITVAAGVSFTGNGAPLGDPAADYAPATVGYDTAPADYGYGLN